jgi:hypothetical protein
MISTFTAFFDANVFFGARLRSLVLYVAQTRLFRARWSDDVHDEWIRSVLAKRPDLTADSLTRTRHLMNSAVPDCLVTGYQSLIPTLILPDPDDRHVLAAALVTRASLIVTFNTADFPAAILGPLHLEARHPDDFLVDQWSLAPGLVVEAIRQDFQHYLRPPLSFGEYIESLSVAGIPKTAALLRELEVLITA